MQQQQEVPPQQSQQQPQHTTSTPNPYTSADQFKHALHEWVKTDNEITTHNNRLKELRLTRTALTPSICNYMERTNSRDLRVELSDGTLRYALEKKTPPFSQKFVLDGLMAYFQQVCPAGDDASQRAQECMQFLKSRQVPEVKAVIKRKYTEKAENTVAGTNANDRV